MDYLMVLPVVFYRIDDNTIACESAFALHLKELRAHSRTWGDRLVVLSPTMSSGEFEANRGYLTLIDCREEGIDHIEAYPAARGRLFYALSWPLLVLPRVFAAVRRAAVVHAGPSDDPFRPFEVLAIGLGLLLGSKTVFVKDIDHRASAFMLYSQGGLSKKSYLLRRHVYDRFVDLQMRFASRYCSLLLLKGQSMVDDYGRGRAWVRNFYDTAHDLSFVLNDEQVTEKCAALEVRRDTIRLVYFGRFVEYKGIGDMIAVARQLSDSPALQGRTVSLTLIGSGAQYAELEALVALEGLGHIVRFKGPMEYGQALFSELYQYDFLLAAPWREDTPRSAFDAMACGLPILAYDSYYYRDLEQHTGAVRTCNWRSTTALAQLVLATKDDIGLQRRMIERGVRFARDNTQEVWLNRRHAWQLECLGDGRPGLQASDQTGGVGR